MKINATLEAAQALANQIEEKRGSLDSESGEEHSAVWLVDENQQEIFFGGGKDDTMLLNAPAAVVTALAAVMGAWGCAYGAVNARPRGEDNSSPLSVPEGTVGRNLDVSDLISIRGQYI